MEASGLLSHLSNPSVLQELTDKLPAQIRLNWAMHKITVPIVTLSTFGNWLFQLAKASSEVTTTPRQPINILKGDNKARRVPCTHILNHLWITENRSQFRNQVQDQLGRYVKPVCKVVLCALKIVRRCKSVVSSGSSPTETSH